MFKALVVDDEPRIRRLLAVALSDDFTVVEAATGTDAINHANSRRFDVFVVDWIMPGVDGIDVVRAVRESTINDEAAIIMVSARTLPEQEREATRAGVDDYLMKPFEPDDLLARAVSLAKMDRPARSAARAERLARLDLG